MRYLGFHDLCNRWPHYTARGLRKLVSRDDFPSPLFAVDLGKKRVWDAADIETYEASHPEMTSAEKKRFKVIGYLRAIGKKRPRSEFGP